LFTFESEEFKKNYVLFYPVGATEEQVEIMAASYISGENGDGELSGVETDEEWDMIEKVLQQFDEEHNHDECDCEDCEEDDCECEEDDCECEEDEHHHCSCHQK
jgi:uncharacterized membrane protein YukC